MRIYIHTRYNHTETYVHTSYLLNKRHELLVKRHVWRLKALWRFYLHMALSADGLSHHTLREPDRTTGMVAWQGRQRKITAAS